MKIYRLIIICFLIVPLQAMQPYVSRDEAETQAISDAPYSHPELWEKHQALYMSIIQDALQAAYHDESDLEDDLNDAAFKNYHLPTLFKYINKHAQRATEKFIKPVEKPHTNTGTSQIKTPCGHIFHKNCIKPWLKEHAECPNCKQALTRKMLTYHFPLGHTPQLCTICREELPVIASRLSHKRISFTHEHKNVHRGNRLARYKPY